MSSFGGNKARQEFGPYFRNVFDFEESYSELDRRLRKQTTQKRIGRSLGIISTFKEKIVQNFKFSLK
jgi:hypothetical protein